MIEIGIALALVALAVRLISEIVCLRHRLARVDQELYELRRDVYRSQRCDDVLVDQVGKLDAVVRLHLGDVLRGVYRR